MYQLPTLCLYTSVMMIIIQVISVRQINIFVSSADFIGAVIRTPALGILS